MKQSVIEVVEIAVVLAVVTVAGVGLVKRVRDRAVGHLDVLFFTLLDFTFYNKRKEQSNHLEVWDLEVSFLKKEEKAWVIS